MLIVEKTVTLGGIAKIDEIVPFLREKYSCSLRWINFWSKEDYIVHYLFSTVTNCSKVVGTADIPSIPGHQIINYRLQCGHT